MKKEFPKVLKDAFKTSQNKKAVNELEDGILEALKDVIVDGFKKKPPTDKGDGPTA